MHALIALLLAPGIVKLNIGSYFVICIFINPFIFNHGKDMVLQFPSIAYVLGVKWTPYSDKHMNTILNFYIANYVRVPQ